MSLMRNIQTYKRIQLEFDTLIYYNSIANLIYLPMHSSSRSLATDNNIFTVFTGCYHPVCFLTGQGCLLANNSANT